jgi:undecaprenyl-diphosphatase
MLDRAIAGLLALDRALFQWVNGGVHPAWLDQVMRIASDGRSGKIEFAIVTLGLLVARGRKQGLVILLGAALTLAASDQLASHVLKPIIRRDRPANTIPRIPVHLLTNRTRTFSFPSSHAANTVAGATYFSRFAPGLTLPLFALAALMSVSRVYVGAHYPLDVLGGALLGCVCGAAVLRLMAWRGLAPEPRHGRAPPDSLAEGLDGEGRRG